MARMPGIQITYNRSHISRNVHVFLASFVALVMLIADNSLSKHEDGMGIQNGVLNSAEVQPCHTKLMQSINSF